MRWSMIDNFGNANINLDLSFLTRSKKSLDILGLSWEKISISVLYLTYSQ
jgi:hypothetical protein